MRRPYKDLGLNQLRGFCEVCRLGSYAEAARQLRLTTSAVWEQVRGLERHYDTRLIEARGGSVAPTPSGVRLLELVGPLLAGLDSTREVLNQELGAEPRSITLASGFRMLMEEVVGAGGRPGRSTRSGMTPRQSPNPETVTMTPHGIEILAHEATDLGILCLRRRALLSEPGTIVTEVTLDHQFLMSSLHTASERALATIALEMHPGASLDVLVGGLGLGYTAHAALGSARVSRVEVVEYLPQVIGWLRRGLFPLSGELEAEPKLLVSEGDVYARLRSAPARPRDLILIDVDHSPEDQLAGANASFYGLAGLRSAREHLAPGGVLGVWSYAESSPFADALHEVFREVRVERVTYWNRHVREECADWLFFARR